uniref:Uncharacterized protein n=1 Tax=Nelumbo nucifera TaxID=4432 RepID=A0A822YD08_NELNU|nr:TPA_asm: hypothetical protein HUJ06_010865 [Nelumbo nucifera]
MKTTAQREIVSLKLREEICFSGRTESREKKLDSMIKNLTTFDPPLDLVIGGIEN